MHNSFINGNNNLENKIPVERADMIYERKQ